MLLNLIGMLGGWIDIFKRINSPHTRVAHRIERRILRWDLNQKIETVPLRRTLNSFLLSFYYFYCNTHNFLLCILFQSLENISKLTSHLAVWIASILKLKRILHHLTVGTYNNGKQHGKKTCFESILKVLSVEVIFHATFC